MLFRELAFGLRILLFVVVLDLILGTFILTVLEHLSLFEGFYLHMASFTTLGGPTPSSATGKTFVVIDAFVGYLFIPVLSAFLSFRWALANLRTVSENYFKREGLSEPVAKKAADFTLRVADMIHEEKLRRLEERLEE